MIHRDLKRFLNDEPIHARPPSPWERVTRWSRQHVVTVTTLMLLLTTSTITLPFVQLGLGDQLEFGKQPASKEQQETTTEPANTAAANVPDDPSPVIEKMKRIVASDPRNAAAFFELARANLKQGNDEEAVNAASVAVALDNRNADYLTLRGAIRIRRGAFNDAMKDLDRAIRFEPHSPEARYQRALASFELNRLDDSLEDVNELLRLRPAHAEGYRLRGRIHAKQAKESQSRRDLETARRLQSETREP